MNYTVIPKSIVNFQTGNSKPIDIYVWATIKYCSNHKTNISHVTEEKLSLLTLSYANCSKLSYIYTTYLYITY